MDNLKKDVQDYIDLDDKIKKLNQELKELKLSKKDSESIILEYMKKEQVDQINLGKGKLKIVKNKTFEPIKKDFIINKLTEGGIPDPEKVTENILKSRKVSETTKIQRNSK